MNNSHRDWIGITTICWSNALFQYNGILFHLVDKLIWILWDINIVCEIPDFISGAKNNLHPPIRNLQSRQKLDLVGTQCDYKSGLREHLRKWTSTHIHSMNLTVMVCGSLWPGHTEETRQRPLMAHTKLCKSPPRKRFIKINDFDNFKFIASSKKSILIEQGTHNI